MAERWQPNAQAVASCDELKKITADFRVVVARAWARWNRIDRTMEHIVEQFRLEYESRIQVVSLDTDNSDFWDLLREASMINVPAFLIFSSGQCVRTIQNAPSPPELLRQLREAVDHELSRPAA